MTINPSLGYAVYYIHVLHFQFNLLSLDKCAHNNQYFESDRRNKLKSDNQYDKIAKNITNIVKNSKFCILHINVIPTTTKTLDELMHRQSCSNIRTREGGIYCENVDQYQIQTGLLLF